MWESLIEEAIHKKKIDVMKIMILYLLVERYEIH